MTTPARPPLPESLQAAVENTISPQQGEKRWSSLSAALGISEAILRHKVAPERGEKRHHLSLAEAIAMAKAAKDFTLIKAICNEFNGEFLEFPDLEESSDNELLSRYTSMMRELGQFSNDIHVSLADGKITASEIADLRKDFLRLTVALGGIMDRLQDKANRDEINARMLPSARCAQGEG